MKVERDVIEGKLDIIERNLKFLNEYKTASPRRFVKSYKDVQAVKHSLLEIMEACIDIANHIISAKGYRRAEEYSEMFEILKEERIIRKELANKLEDMARFRNLLVHRYGDIDNERVLDIVKRDLRDVVEFEKEIEDFLDKEAHR
ncbi:MAG: DUF86 domain-containing protein [Candidatus Brockarchaeota archaeon]|nr:DUF86 domain-containing protein [Candidatus Brockarchaeota archaeon]